MALKSEAGVFAQAELTGNRLLGAIEIREVQSGQKLEPFLERTQGEDFD